MCCVDGVCSLCSRGPEVKIAGPRNNNDKVNSKFFLLNCFFFFFFFL